MGRGRCCAGASICRGLCVYVSSRVVVSPRSPGIVVITWLCFMLPVPGFFRRAGTFVIKYVFSVVQFLSVWCSNIVCGSIGGDCLLGCVSGKFTLVWTKSSSRIGPSCSSGVVSQVSL